MRSAIVLVIAVLLVGQGCASPQSAATTTTALTARPTALYSVRSERAFCEELDYNLLFRWFLGMQLMERSFDATTPAAAYAYNHCYPHSNGDTLTYVPSDASSGGHASATYANALSDILTNTGFVHPNSHAYGNICFHTYMHTQTRWH